MSSTTAIDSLLSRGIHEVVEIRHLRLRLKRGRPLRVKLGIDPTNVYLHLGHTVPLSKLHEFQMAGHTAVLIIGDVTAQIGDPSGRDKTRPRLSAKQVEHNAEQYLEQVGKVINLKHAEVHRQSEWFNSFTLPRVMELLGSMTVQQLLAHETFRDRLKADQPLGMHELLYPLLQGYDSVAVEADVELGGLDQKFNLLAGRAVQAASQQEPQDIVLLDYLIGTDGKQKMGKSLNNYIAIQDAPEEMFGKIMSVPDKLIPHYSEVLTSTSPERIKELTKQLRGKKVNPRDLKIDLAKTIVTNFYSAEAAATAAEEWRQVFSKKGKPTSMPSISVRPGEHQIVNLLISHQLCNSRSEARRLIEQGGLKINQRQIKDWTATITIQAGDTLQIGKRRFVKVSAA